MWFSESFCDELRDRSHRKEPGKRKLRRFSDKILLSGWKKTGLYSLNPSIVLDQLFTKSESQEILQEVS
jgi:hypothetical protein